MQYEKSFNHFTYLDFFLCQLHYPVTRHKLNPYLDAMAEKVKRGKVKAIGISNFNTELLKRAHAS